MIPRNQPSQRYRELQVMTASPIQRLLMVYDAAVMGCNQRDLKRTTDALNVLRNSLDFDQGAAAGFFHLYQHCADLARQDRYDEAAEILRGLVQAWIEVLVREKDASHQATAQVGFSLAG